MAAEIAAVTEVEVQPTEDGKEQEVVINIDVDVSDGVQKVEAVQQPRYVKPSRLPLRGRKKAIHSDVSTPRSGTPSGEWGY